MPFRAEHPGERTDETGSEPTTRDNARQRATTRRRRTTMNRPTMSRLLAASAAAILALGVVGCETEPTDGNPDPAINGGLGGGGLG